MPNPNDPAAVNQRSVITTVVTLAGLCGALWVLPAVFTDLKTARDNSALTDAPSRSIFQNIAGDGRGGRDPFAAARALMAAEHAPDSPGAPTGDGSLVLVTSAGVSPAQQRALLLEAERNRPVPMGDPIPITVVGVSDDGD